ncbi:hypothetical protein D3C71_1150530 [compost metagenome]
MTAEIIPFPCPQNEMAAHFAALAAAALAGRITGYVIATVGPERLSGDIETGWNNVDLAERAALAQHLQFDVIGDLIDEKITEVLE